MEHTVSRCREIIDQPGGSAAQNPGQRFLLDFPGNIGRMSETFSYRSRNTQARDSNCTLVLDEITEHYFEARELLRAINLVMYSRKGPAARAIEAQMRFGRSDITG
jgi:hypothetical protein